MKRQGRCYVFNPVLVLREEKGRDREGVMCLTQCLYLGLVFVVDVTIGS